MEWNADRRHHVERDAEVPRKLRTGHGATRHERVVRQRWQVCFDEAILLDLPAADCLSSIS